MKIHIPDCIASDPERLAEFLFEIDCHDELQTLMQDVFVSCALTFDDGREKFRTLRLQWEQALLA
jgi:hypothetical protein